MKIIFEKKYIMRNASDKREPKKYVWKILRSIRNAEMIIVQNQFDILYNDLNVEIKQNDIKRI